MHPTCTPGTAQQAPGTRAPNGQGDHKNALDAGREKQFRKMGNNTELSSLDID